MQYKVVVYHPFNKKYLSFTEENLCKILAKLPQLSCKYVISDEEFYREIVVADFILALNLDKDIYKYAKNLKAIFTCMASKDSIPIGNNNNISYYYGTFHGKLISETLLSSIMYFNQNFDLLNINKGNNFWGDSEIYGKRVPLYKQSVAIIGYGSIGRYCATYLSKLDMQVYAIQRTHKSGHCQVSGATYVHTSEINSILHMVSHVVSTLPDSKETNNIFNYDFFTRMNKNAYFYNFGRGNSVVEKDLILSLNNKEISGALLDVFKKEPLPKNSLLWDTENLLITPHVSTYYDSYLEHYSVELIEQLSKELNKK